MYLGSLSQVINRPKFSTENPLWTISSWPSSRSSSANTQSKALTSFRGFYQHTHNPILDLVCGVFLSIYTVRIWHFWSSCKHTQSKFWTCFRNLPQHISQSEFGSFTNSLGVGIDLGFHLSIYTDQVSMRQMCCLTGSWQPQVVWQSLVYTVNQLTCSDTYNKR